MTETQNDEESQSAATASKQAAPRHASDYPAYTYESAGITERRGEVPAWLWAVVVSLLVWGVYYLVTYWNAPVT